MSFIEIEFKDGTSVLANVLAKTITAMVIRTVDNKYLLVSRDFLKDESKFKFRD